MIIKIDIIESSKLEEVFGIEVFLKNETSLFKIENDIFFQMEKLLSKSTKSVLFKFDRKD